MKKTMAVMFIALLLSLVLYQRLEAIGTSMCYEPRIECYGVTVDYDHPLELWKLCDMPGLVLQTVDTCSDLPVVVDNGSGLQLNTHNPQQAGLNE